MSQERPVTEPELPLFDLPLYEEGAARSEGGEALHPEPIDRGNASEARGLEAAAGPLGVSLRAGLADLSLHGGVLGTVALLASFVLGAAPGWDALPAFGVLALVFSFLYWTVSLAFWGQTPGMAWVGQRAQSVTGEPLTYGQTALRWIGAVATAGLVGLPLLLVSIDGRSLSDRLSDSRTQLG